MTHNLAVRTLWPILLLLLAGCGLAAEGGVSGPLPDLPGCDQTDQFAFVGETSTAALGLGDFGADSSRVGMVWVTADRVDMDMGAPPGVGEPAHGELSRMVCVQWDDGSGMSGPIDDDWQPPAAAAPPLTPGEFPMAPVAVGVLLALLIGASVLAFRGE